MILHSSVHLPGESTLLMESDCVHDQLLLERVALVHSILLIINIARCVEESLATNLEVQLPLI